MDEFEIDPELSETLRGIRDSVRRLFEQLRLQHQDGDISGKERLERVPALAKHNFRNLTSPISHLAIKEAWRLIDFLEGGGGEARLSVRAREALRGIELDKQLATFRASIQWKNAAADLRQTLGIPRDALPLAGSLAENAAGPDQVIFVADVSPTAPLGTAPRANKSRRPALGLIMVVATPIALAALTTIWWFAGTSDSPSACLALEDASEGERAAHWARLPETPVPRPPIRANARPHVFLIADPLNGGPVQSIWTTSQFSFAERTKRAGPGGGRLDFRLRVGGWGDTYVSLLKVPVPTNRLVQRAVIQLTVLGDAVGSRPTTMTLRVINESWDVGSGPSNRLWWRNCPQSAVVRNHLPAPGQRDSVYEIEITDLYNMWAVGQQVPYGIMLEPENIGSWGPGRPQYSNFSTFYSTRARDPANRPRLVLTY